MKLFIQTFGCRVNQYETERLRERLTSGSGDTCVEDYEEADLCVVNTCTVTREADKDALLLIRRIARRNPAAKLVVTGCLASRAPAEILAAAPHAVVAGNEAKDGLAEALGCAPSTEGAGLRAFGGRSRAHLKVQDGCDMGCSYCIVPLVRPTPSSRPVPEVVAELGGLLAGGFQEVVLCGIRLGRYLSEDGGKRVDLVGLIERLLALPGDFRLRLSSFEVTDVTERFLSLAVGSGGRLCPSFHVPLQSGSDAVLKRMGRWYSTAFFERRVQALKQSLPSAGLFTDVMVGFPGETEGDFRLSLALLERLGFSGLHIFPFSARPGSPAAGFEPLPAGVVKERMARMRELDDRLRRAFAARALGAKRRVLVEGEEPGAGAGEAEGTAEDFLRVRLDRYPGPGLRWATVVRVEGASAWGRVEG